ncbi:hypothetical protein [Nocardia sp. NPDC058497]|uniref:hypothetical protein n=1 Tax=Nocardia sp. NPDC058497 TaxID=3346529 RepID=UPI00366450A0
MSEITSSAWFGFAGAALVSVIAYAREGGRHDHRLHRPDKVAKVKSGPKPPQGAAAVWQPQADGKPILPQPVSTVVDAPVLFVIKLDGGRDNAQLKQARNHYSAVIPMDR